MEEKRLIRKQIFAARKQCADEQVEEWSRQLTERVIRLPEFLQADRVMAYADYNHEVMTRFIIEEAWKSGKEVAVPKVVGKDMVFYRLTDFSQLAPGYFGIPEPSDVWTAIGPSICQDCYEVSEDVAQEFISVFEGRADNRLLYRKENGKYQLNLWRANELVLLESGVPKDRIAVTDICTCCNPQVLFSHRASKGKRGNLGAFLQLLS